jgi:hypothetical protein
MKKKIDKIDMNEGLEWLRSEVLKDINEINWIKVVRTSNLLYRQKNDKSSYFGITKGYVNLIKVGGIYSCRELAIEMKKLYGDENVLLPNNSHKVVHMIKDGIITTDTIVQKPILLFTDKNTVESVFHRHGIPFIKFHLSDKGYKHEDGTYHRVYNWKRENDSPIKFEKNDFIAINRDGILSTLLDD